MTTSQNSPEPQPPESRRRRARRWLRRNALAISVTLLMISWLLVYLAPSVVFNIYPGEVGVVWKRLDGGTDLNNLEDEGLRLIYPWDKLYKYNLRMQEIRRTFDVLSSDGLRMSVDVSVRFRVLHEHVALLHKHVGPNYVEVLILPEVIR